MPCFSLCEGHRKEFLVPDRSKYVSMDKHFLKSYLELVVKVNLLIVQTFLEIL